MKVDRLSLEIVVACNSDEILHRDLLRSRMTAEYPVFVERGHVAAGRAYNASLAKGTSDYVAFVHQDVYLPERWDFRLNAAIDRLENSGVPWGVLGVWGLASPAQYCGKVWCTGGNQQHAGLIGLNEVVSIDEIVIVIKRSSGLRFDERLPGFHLYATDIVLEARKRGLKTFVFDGPVVHNSRANPQPLDRHYFAAYRYMQRKWAEELPLPTCVVPVTRTTWPLWKQWAKNEVRRARGRFTPHSRLEDPARQARLLGYEEVPDNVAASFPVS